jgi:hypothetical protein
MSPELSPKCLPRAIRIRADFLALDTQGNPPFFEARQAPIVGLRYGVSTVYLHEQSCPVGTTVGSFDEIPA